MALNTYSFLVALNGLNIRQDISVTDYDTKYTAMLSDAMSFLNSKIFFLQNTLHTELPGVKRILP